MVFRFWKDISPGHPDLTPLPLPQGSCGVNESAAPNPLSFVDGAVLSAFATARELGSDLIGPDDDRLMKISARLFRR